MVITRGSAQAFLVIAFSRTDAKMTGSNELSFVVFGCFLLAASYCCGGTFSFLLTC
jgi:hypothetical protein